jgi:hypothetical protein
VGTRLPLGEGKRRADVDDYLNWEGDGTGFLPDSIGISPRLNPDAVGVSLPLNLRRNDDAIPSPRPLPPGEWVEVVTKDRGQARRVLLFTKSLRATVAAR